MIIQDYLDLITSQHQDKPDFIATVSLSVAASVRIQELLDSMTALGGIFDLDTPPVGDQLDIIGQWAGASRDVLIPISGVFFTWDGIAAVGWEFGVWQPLGGPTQLVTLPNDIYLLLVRAKIAANHWDGTTEGAYLIWEILFPNFNLLIVDNQDMSFLLALEGGPVDSLTQALLTGGYLPLKPETIRISQYVVSVDANPLFAWDVVNANVDGWDTGSWGQELAGS